MTFQIFQLQEAKKKGVKKGVYRDYIVQVRSRKDGKPVSQKAAEHIKKVAKAQATVEARATPESQEGESVSPSPFAEVAAIHAEIGTPDRAGRVPGLGFGARPTQLFTSSGSRGTQGYSPASSGATQHARQQEDRLRARELELAERAARLKADEDRLAREYEDRRQAHEQEVANWRAEFKRQQEEFFRAQERRWEERGQASSSRVRRRRRRSAEDEDEDEDEDRVD